MALSDILKGKTAQEIEQYASIALDGIEAILNLTGNPAAIEAAAVLEGVKAVASEVVTGVQGTVTSASVKADEAKVDGGISANDVAADAAAAAKFGTTTH